MPPATERDRVAHGILMRAMELGVAERAAFVARECAGDESLQRYVLDLLTAADRAGAFLETPALGGGVPEEPPIPDAVGNYLIVGVLGAGGMATVYEAEQEQPRRRVALKVLHQGMRSRETYLRFQFETEALARLQHPGIAQIYEAGATHLGSAHSPFFAMELVPDAVTLTRHAEASGLSMPERARLLIAVCEAVHHGHQNGIIHRDLKPGNILVGRDGVPKVIDFGVAKAISHDAGSPTTIASASSVLGTLNYMSPEQCGAPGEVDVRSDVYSLGVVLYELAIGRVPHDVSRLPIPAALATIMRDPAPRPQLTNSKADRDLAAIIAKAVEKDPGRRYDSASALSADLRRWLDREPISARPPSLIESGVNFARRHKALVAVSATVGASLLLVAAISFGFAVRLADEVGARREAQARLVSERDRARWEAYVANVAGALSAMTAGEFEQVRHRLEVARPLGSGWELGFLSRRAERSASSLAAHDGMILDVSFSPDGQRFVTASSDGSVRLWSAADWEPLASFSNGTGARVMALSFSSDGTRVRSGDSDGTLHDLKADGLIESLRIPGQGNAIRSVVSLPESTVLVADSAGRTRFLGADSEQSPISDQPGGIHLASVSPDGTLLATANDAGRVWIRDVGSLEPVARLEFPGAVNQVRFSPNSRRVAAAGASGNVLVWRLPGGEPEATIPATRGETTVRSLAFSDDGAMLAAGLTHRGIVVFSLPGGERLGELGGHTDAVAAVRFREHDRELLSASWDGTVRTWLTSEFASPGGTSVRRAHMDYVFGVRFAPDGSTLASVSRDGTVRWWNPDLENEPDVSRVGVPLTSLAFSPDGRRLALGGTDGSVRLADRSGGPARPLEERFAGAVYTVAVSPSGTRLAAGAEDGWVRVWDLPSGGLVSEWAAHSARVQTVCFAPDGSVLATGSRDGTVRMWDPENGTERPCEARHNSDVFAVLFSRDGSRLFTGSRDQTIGVWDVPSGVLVESVTGHGQFVTCLALNPDGTRLAAGSWFGEVVLFDVATLDQIASFRAHDSAIRGIDFSPNGRWLATGSVDSTVRLFDSASRAEAEAARGRTELATSGGGVSAPPVGGPP